MKTALIILSALWVTVLGSGLCLAGLLEHSCDDSHHGTSCGHEEDCFADPCNNVLLRPQTSMGHSMAQPVGPGCVQLSASSDLPQPDAAPLPQASCRLNLPRPQSDLPLLI